LQVNLFGIHLVQTVSQDGALMRLVPNANLAGMQQWILKTDYAKQLTGLLPIAKRRLYFQFNFN
jgi:hypothetical protein